MISLQERVIAIAVIIGILFSIVGMIGPAFIIFASVAGLHAGGIIGKWVYYAKNA